jgi:ribonuclease P protein component
LVLLPSAGPRSQVALGNVSYSPRNSISRTPRLLLHHPELVEGSVQPVFFGIPSSESLPRARVIRRRAIFDATRAKGRRVNNRWFTLSFLPRDAAPPGETGYVAFLTPKRIGPATVRNRLRRRMREIYRRHLQAPSETRYLIWIARPPALELEFEPLRLRMTELSDRLAA